MTGKVLVDTGPLVAVMNENDQHHQECVGTLQTLSGPLLTCWPVVAEATFLLRKRASLDAARRLLNSLDGEFLRLLPLTGEDAKAIDLIMSNYADNKLDLADACIMHLADREGIDTVFTIDQTDFRVYRPQSFAALHLLPE